MIVLDFLFYYLTYWFEKHKDKLKWSTPLERAVYAVGLMSTLWIYSFGEILRYTVKGFDYKFSMIIYILIGLGIMQLYKYIYIIKSRYQLLVSRKTNPGNVSIKIGTTISIIVMFISVLLPLIVLLIFVPFGGHQKI
jgi:hypothetical protein